MNDALLQALDVDTPDESLVRQIEAMLKIEKPTALARATGLLLWKRAWVVEYGEQRGGDRRSPAALENQGENFSFAATAGEQLGLTERAIYLDVALAEQLGARDIRRLWASKIADNALALRTVAGLPNDQRASLYRTMHGSPDASFASWLVEAGLKTERDSDEWAFTRLYDLWVAANDRVKRRFLQQIGGTAGVTALLRKRRAS